MGWLACYCSCGWRGGGAVGRDRMTFIPRTCPYDVTRPRCSKDEIFNPNNQRVEADSTSKKELKLRRMRNRLSEGARWLPAMRLLRRIV